MARCSFLAEVFEKKGIETTFLSQAETLPNFLKIKNLKQLGSGNELEETLAAIKSEPGKKILVVDSYLKDATWESKVRPHVDKLVVIDDLANRKHDCSILVDCGYQRKVSDYTFFVPSGTKLLVGLPYCMISSSFRNLKEVSKDQGRIHLFFGSTVSFSTLIEYYFALKKEFPRSRFNLAHAAKISAEEKTQWETRRGENDQLFCEEPLSVSLKGCALAIGSPGIAVWERAYLGVPGFYISVNENQVPIIRDLETLNFCKYVGSLNDLAGNVSKLKTWLAQNTVAELQKSIAGKVDGLGLERIVEEVLREA